MEVYLNSITGIDDAMVSLFMSKQHWTRGKEEFIRDVVRSSLDHKGKLIHAREEYTELLEKVCKYGKQHTELLRYIKLSVTVNGLHRAGQDDWDSHVRRMDAMVRASTRLSDFTTEVSDFYKGKIIPFADAGVELPDTIIHDEHAYVRYANGYIREDMKKDKDVKRGLYLLSIPSSFIYKIGLPDHSHMYKLRNENGTANPEVKQCMEMLSDQIEDFQPMFTRKFMESIKC